MSNNHLLQFCTKTVSVSVRTNGRFLSGQDTQKGRIEFSHSSGVLQVCFWKAYPVFYVSFSHKNLSVDWNLYVQSDFYLSLLGGGVSSTGLLRLCAPRWCQPGLLHDAGPHIPHELVVHVLPRWPVRPHRNCDHDSTTMKTKNLSWSIVPRSG